MSLRINSALARIPRPQLPEKFKGTIVERWVNYWKGLARDYKDVSIETFKFMRENRVRSAIYAGIGSLAYTGYKTNPTYLTFTDQLKSSQNKMTLVFEDSQNHNSVTYLKYVEKRRNTDTLRVTSFGIFSILWVDDYASQLATPDATCKYLEPAFKTFHERIIDVGFFGKWWNIEEQMKDYDIN